MRAKRFFSAFCAAVFVFTAQGATFAKEKEVGEIQKGEIGFVGGDFENLTKNGDTYYAPDMRAYTTYGNANTISGLSALSAGKGELPIVTEGENHVLRLQPKTLSDAAKSTNGLANAFGFRLLRTSDYGKITDIVGDVKVSFKIKIADSECLKQLAFVTRPNHTACGQYTAPSGKAGNKAFTNSEFYGASTISDMFPSGEWVNVELNFPHSIFYEKADFAAHTWGGSHGDHTILPSEAERTPVFFVRPYFNYGDTAKSLENYTYYLDDFEIDVKTSAGDVVTEVDETVVSPSDWTVGTMADATDVTAVSKNGADAWQFDPAINTSISGFEVTNGDKWTRAGQRMCLQASLSGKSFDKNSWYKLTAYVMTKDGVSANSALGTAQDLTKTWVGKPLLGIKLTGSPEQTYESADIKNYFKNVVISEDAKTDWQKIELCFKPGNTSYQAIQLNAAAGVDERYVGEYKNMVLPTFWIRKDITLERVDTEYFTKNENILDSAAPQYKKGSNSLGWLFASNGTYTAYPKKSGNSFTDMGISDMIRFYFSEPLDCTKNYKISFNIKTNDESLAKARVRFYGEDTEAALVKEIPAEAKSRFTPMYFDAREVSQKDAPLGALGDITSIAVTVDSGDAVYDKSVSDDVSFTVTDFKIVCLDTVLDYDITLKGQKATLSVSNKTGAGWNFTGRLFAAEYDENGRILQFTVKDNVDMNLKAGETVTESAVFKNEFAEGSKVKAFLWEPGAVVPVTEAFVLK